MALKPNSEKAYKGNKEDPKMKKRRRRGEEKASLKEP